MRPLIKICGITTSTDAELVSSYFPDFLGFIIHPPSPRHLDFKNLSEVSDFLRVGFGDACPQLIGVFVNPSLETLDGHAPFLDGFQLHGDESPEQVHEVQKKFPDHILWKALRPQSQNDLTQLSSYPMVDGILVDGFSSKAYGGTGTAVLSNLLPHLYSHLSHHQKLFIAGGITSENASQILNESKAHGLDLSSSLENSPGHKSEKKVSIFFHNIAKAGN